MFLAVRDLRFARGRFALMGAVVALITFMVVLLSGLTDGLGQQSTSAITNLSADRVAIATEQGESASFSTSEVSPQAVERVRSGAGVSAADGLVIANGRATVGERTVPVAYFGADPGGVGAPARLATGTAVVGAGLDAKVGDQITVGATTLRVAGVSDQASYSHQPVVWVPMDVVRTLGGVDQSAVTAVLMRTDRGFSSETLQKATGLTVYTPSSAVSAIGSYESEHGSLLLMKVLLLLISALVIGAFFTVWTVQRAPDLAVLKAMGASTAYLVRDALAQAAVLLVIGGLAGAALATGVAFAVDGSVPMIVSASTTVSPFLMLLGVGLVGAVASLRRIATVDPITALGSAR